jgi:hypothetical protein
MAGYISRDRIQFESFGDLVDDGNEQMHTREAAEEWQFAAAKYLAEAGVDAQVEVGHGTDFYRFAVRDIDSNLADEADAAGMNAAQKYIDEAILSQQCQ